MVGFPSARITDMHLCPMVTGVVPHVGGPVTGPCSPNVLTGMLPQARVGDIATCVGPPDPIVMGSPTVLVNGLPAARIVVDSTAHGGRIVLGCFTVLIGGIGAGAVPSASLAIARRLVRPGGSGTAEDAELVAQQLAALPPGMLAQMEADGTRGAVLQGSVGRAQ